MSARMHATVATGLEISVTFALLAAIWFATANSTSPYVPSLQTILDTFWHAWTSSANLTNDLVPSVYRLLVGFALAGFFGVVIGIATGLSAVLRAMAMPVMSFVRALPAPVLVPAFLVLLGIGSEEKIGIIAFVCTWPIALNTQDGVTGLDPLTMETARSFGISRLDRFRYVLLPAISPRIFAGLRMSSSLAILMLVVAEMLGSANGVGYFAMYSAQTYDIPDMWAGVLLLGILGFALNWLLVKAESRALRWHFGRRGIEL